MVISVTKPAKIVKEHLNVLKSQKFLIALCILSMVLNVGMIHIILVIAFNMDVHIFQKIHVEVSANGLAHVYLKNVTH